MNFLIGLHESGCYIAPSTQLTLDNISISSEGKICIPFEHVKLVSLMICVGESVVYASQMKSVLARSIVADYRMPLLYSKTCSSTQMAHLLFSSCQRK